MKYITYDEYEKKNYKFALVPKEKNEGVNRKENLLALNATDSEEIPVYENIKEVIELSFYRNLYDAKRADSYFIVAQERKDKRGIAYKYVTLTSNYEVAQSLMDAIAHASIKRNNGDLIISIFDDQGNELKKDNARTLCEDKKKKTNL